MSFDELAVKKTQQDLSTKTGKIPIVTVRNKRVVLDFDLAAIYGATTGALNQAIKRNPKRFPEDFSFVLEREEVASLISQNVISKSMRGGRTQPPRVFTEHGALMAATVLNSEQAVAMSLYVIRAFVEMREQMAANASILARLAEIDKSLFLHDEALRDIYRKLIPLLSPPAEKPKPAIGFKP